MAKAACFLLVSGGLLVVCLAASDQQLKKNESDKFPITLSLKKKLIGSVNPKKGVPDISYKKAAEFTAKKASWIVEIDVMEDGKAVTYTITQGDKKLAVISLPKETGSFTGKEGKWQSTVELFLSFSNAKGKGTMRMALIDLKEFQTKEKAAEARKLSKWLEIPIHISD
jgi:hypothetical protein